MNTSTPSEFMLRANKSRNLLRLLVLMVALSFSRLGIAQLVVIPPPDVTVECSDPTDTGSTGEATAEGGCMPAWINEFHYDNAGIDTMEFLTKL